MQKRVVFRSRLLPYLLVAPQIAVTAIFFLWPAAQALWQSLLIEDPFGLSTKFVWFENYAELLSDPNYLEALSVTFVFSLGTAGIALFFGLLFAVMADRVFAGASGYKLLLMLPYAVAPVVAGVLWLFMFNPSFGAVTRMLGLLGYRWNHVLEPGQALFLVIVAAAWKYISYNFLFFLAALQSIPKSLIEAAAIDGAGPVRRFFSIIFPLISPTTFFLLVVNIVYAFFETFGIIHAVTAGGPGRATTTLVYKVFNDGFIGLDLGGSAAQSVVLMLIVIGLTVVQFRWVERKVHY